MVHLFQYQQTKCTHSVVITVIFNIHYLLHVWGLRIFDVVKIEVVFIVVLLRHAYISHLLFFLDVLSLSRNCTA